MNARITPEQKVAFCKFISTNKDTFDAITEDMNYTLFQQFITATDEQRKVIGDILNAGSLWEAELNRILNESISDPNG